MAKRGRGEGSLYRRRDGRWVACISVGNGKRECWYRKTRKAAHEQLQAALREQEQGALIPGAQQTVAQFLRQWLEAHQATVRFRTYVRYEEIIRLRLIPSCGCMQLRELSPQLLSTVYGKMLGEGLSPTTVRLVHTVFHRALDDATRWGLVARNVCNAVSPPRREKHEIRPLSTDQARVLLQTVKDEPLEALIVLALLTGMRRGEILALHWHDIDFSTSTLQVRRIQTRIAGRGFTETEPKTERSRRCIILAPLASEALARHRLRQFEAKLLAGTKWRATDLVFTTTIGTPLSPSKVVATFKRLLQRAGLPPIRFHDLRHSAATLLLSIGIHPKVVQEMLGHSAIAITMDTYSHVLPTLQRDAVSRLNDVLQD